jgi:hypothetical protein
MWAAQSCCVGSEYLQNNGSCFLEEVQFSEEQSVARKSKRPPNISRLPNIFRSKGLRHRDCKEFSTLQRLKSVQRIGLVFVGHYTEPFMDQTGPFRNVLSPLLKIYHAS